VFRASALWVAVHPEARRWFERPPASGYADTVWT